MVEPQIVVLVVAGSSPVGHPSFANSKNQIPSAKGAIVVLGVWNWVFGIMKVCL